MLNVVLRNALSLAGSFEQSLAPSIWESFLTSLGCSLGHMEDKAESGSLRKDKTESGSLKKDKAESGSPMKDNAELGSPRKDSPVKTQMHLLPYTQVTLCLTLNI